MQRSGLPGPPRDNGWKVGDLDSSLKTQSQLIPKRELGFLAHRNSPVKCSCFVRDPAFPAFLANVNFPLFPLVELLLTPDFTHMVVMGTVPLPCRGSHSAGVIYLVPPSPPLCSVLLGPEAGKLFPRLPYKLDSTSNLVGDQKAGDQHAGPPSDRSRCCGGSCHRSHRGVVGSGL